MNDKQIRETLARHPFFAGLTEADIDKLAGLAFGVDFQPDQIIFHEGEQSRLFYIILSGQVAIEIQAPGHLVRIQTIGKDEELGWSSLLGNVKKQFQARCLEPVHALGFVGDYLIALYEHDSAFGFRLLRQVLTTVAERLHATRLQLLDVYARPGGPGQ
jgi:CRP-like cAMP-binding protein